jgi:hydrogenase-1 operon protein HyaF
MSGLEDIGVEVTGCGPGDVSRGNVIPLLHEIRHALETLINTGESSTIDLLSLPMSPGDLELLETELGTGEVDAQLNALGPSRIRETAYPGVWLVEHHNAEDQPVAKFIEVTRLPDILRTDDRELPGSLAALDRALNHDGET